jgi:hypothetical protein
MMTQAEMDYTLVLTVQLLRVLLRKKFKPTKFRVKERPAPKDFDPSGRPRYLLRIEWTDGPTAEQVQSITSALMEKSLPNAAVTLVTMRSEALPQT